MSRMCIQLASDDCTIISREKAAIRFVRLGFWSNLGSKHTLDHLGIGIQKYMILNFQVNEDFDMIVIHQLTDFKWSTF